MTLEKCNFESLLANVRGIIGNVKTYSQKKKMSCILFDSVLPILHGTNNANTDTSTSILDVR